MSKDIENILGNINFEVETEQEWLEPLGLDRNTWKQILNYINKLAKENKELEKQLENKIDLYEDTISYQLGFDKGKEELQQRIDKAIEYINKRFVHEGEYWVRKAYHFRNTEYGKDLLEILGDKE